jgi:Ca-activated chloride channel family protein
VASLVDKLEGDRIGIIAFAGEAFVQCPLTLDYGAAKIFLDVLEPGLIPTPGTALGQAIEQAMKSFESAERKHKVMVLITDGEDTQDQDILEAAKAAELEGVIIYTVGIGSPQGVPIPVFDERGNQIGFKKDRQGEVVVSKLDELALEKIALQTGGKYYRASSGEAELDRIYEAISGMEKKELASLKFSQFEERFQYVLGIALFLLILETLLSERRKAKQQWRGRFVP